MPTPDDLPAQIIALIAKSKQLDPATLTPQTTFDELQIDSLDKINLTFEIEELYAIAIPDASLTSLRTITDVISGVQTLLAQKQTPAQMPQTPPQTPPA